MGETYGSSSRTKTTTRSIQPLDPILGLGSLGVGPMYHPMMLQGADVAGIYAQSIADADKKTTAAQSALDTLGKKYGEMVDQPMVLPHLPVEPERGPIGTLLPNLFSGLASAITNNPAYLQNSTDRLTREELARRQAMQQNTLLDRDQITQARAEHLTMMTQRLSMAQQNLEREGNYEQAMKVAQMNSQVQAQIQKMSDTASMARTQEQGKSSRDVAGIEGQYKVRAVFAESGFEQINGEWHLVNPAALNKGRGGSGHLLQNQDERLQLMQKYDQLLQDPKLKDKNTRLALSRARDAVELAPIETEGFDAVIQRIRAKYPLSQQTQMDKTFALGHEWYGLVPGAKEYVDAVDAELTKVAHQKGATTGSTPGGGGKAQESAAPAGPPAEYTKPKKQLPLKDHARMAQSLLSISTYDNFDDLMQHQYEKGKTLTEMGYNVATLRDEYNRLKRDEAEKIKVEGERFKEQQRQKAEQSSRY